MLKRHPRSRFVLPLALAMAAGSASTAAAQVQWRSPVAPAFAPEKDAGAALKQIIAQPRTRHLAVQLLRPITDADRSRLAAAGIRLCSPLGGSAFFASVDGDKLRADDPAIAELLAGVQAIDPLWKISAALVDPDPSAWVSVGTVETKDGKSEPVVAVYVLLHTDVPNDANTAAMVARHGGVVRDTIRTVNGLVVELPLSSAFALAAEDAVQWIEPALPLLTPTNAENRALTRSNQAQAAPYNLDGTGITVLVFDAGVARVTHQDFGGRATAIDAGSTQNHATHVAGTVGGSGAASGGNNRGMAPGVSILTAGLTAGTGFLYTNPGDIEADYTLAITLGAHISNNSIGTNVNANGSPCSWHGDYGVTDGVIDSIVRGSEAVSDGEAFRVVWAAGNERGGRCDDGSGFRTIGPPAGAKNHLSIGAVNANNDTMTTFSGWGPTDDGRLKPDFCAPGCQSGGDGGVTSCSSSSDTAYSVSCGTSMASPTAAGISALLLQDWVSQFPGEPLPRNSMLKVILAQSAVDLGQPGPDYTFGYGSIRADAAIDLLRVGAVAERELLQGFSDIYSVTVGDDAAPLVVTVAWDDVPGTPNVIPSLVNDLDLVVLSPSGQRHYPWTLNPASPGDPAARTGEDHLNNIEQVRIDAPESGVWSIQVRGSLVPIGPQAYSIVASDPTFELTGGVRIAIEPVTLAADAVAPGSPVPLQVALDVQGDTLVPGSMQVHYRLSGGAFTSVSMNDMGSGLYQAALPALSCEHAPEYFFSATAEQLGTVTLPTAGGAAPYSSLVGNLTTTFFDMETSAGWVSGAPGDNATSGLWERGVPQSTAAQPGEDHTPDPGVNCWITGAAAGAGVGTFDVDNGTTTLRSPVLDLSNATDATRIGYWRWYSNTAGAAPNADVFVVDISADGGTNWTNVEVVGPTGEGTSGGWFYHEFRVTDFIPLTGSVRMRFVASDLGSGSIVEAAIDDVTIFAVSCDDTCAADFDGNGTVEVPDIFAFLAAWFAQQPAADFDGVGGVAVPDIFAFLSAWFGGC